MLLSSWVLITSSFNEQAGERGRPQRELTSLRKHYMLLLSSKNTGAGGPSQWQQRARDVEQRAHRSVGGVLLADDSLADASNQDEDGDGGELEDLLDEADGVATKGIYLNPTCRSN